MCMLAILRNVVDGWPVILAANREEFYDRQGTPPEVWVGSPTIVAGRDPKAGGTWLGVNEYRLLVAITNRPKERVTREPRSRGLLCLELLACHSAGEAQDRAMGLLRQGHYAGCNVLAVDHAATCLVESGDAIVSSTPGVGVYVVTTNGLNQPGDTRAALAAAELRACPRWSLESCLAQLMRICGQHAAGDRPPICLHAPDRGTVSSSIVAFGTDSADLRWLHAQGPPCRSRFIDYSMLFQRLAPRSTTANLVAGPVPKTL